MTNPGRRVLSPGLTWCLTCLTLSCGCAPPGPAPLDPKALLQLEGLSPSITTPVNPPETASPGILSSLKEAERLLSAKEYGSARVILDSLQRKIPGDPYLLRNIGVLRAAQEDLDKAISNLTEALQTRPDDLEGQWVLGRIFRKRKRNDEAILRFRTALRCSQSKPENPLGCEVLLELGELLKEEGFWSASLECYEALGASIDKHGRNFLGRPRIREFVLRPEQLLLLQGELLLSLRRDNDGVKALHRAYLRDQTNSTTTRKLLEGLVRTGAFPQAESLLLEIAKDKSRQTQLPEFAEIVCLAVKDREMPGRIWQSFLKSNPVNPSVAVGLGRILSKLGEAGRAEEMLKEGLREVPGNVELTTALSSLYAENNRPLSAVMMLSKLLGSNPGTVRAVRRTFRRNVLQHLPRNFERTLINQIETTPPPFQQALHYLIGLLGELRNDKQLSEEQYTGSIRHARKFAPGYEALTDLYLSQQRYKDAAALVIKARDADPKGFLPHYLQGKIRLARGDRELGIQSLQQSRSLNRRHLSTLLLLGKAYPDSGRSHLGITTLLEALKSFPDETEVYRRLFRLYVRHRLYSQGRAVTNRLRERFPRSFTGALMQIELDVLSGKHERAKKHIAELQAIHPENTELELLAIKAELLSHRELIPNRSFDEMVRRCVKLIADDSENPDPRGLLTQILNQPGKTAQGVKVWARLHKRFPTRREIAILHATFLYKTKRYDEAAKIFEDLLNQDPRENRIRLMLLDVLESADVGEAIRVLEKWTARTTESMQTTPFRLRLLKLYRESERFKEAHKLLDDWIASGSVRSALLTRLRSEKLSLFTEEQRYDEGIEYARRWAQVDPDQPLPRKHLIDLLSQTERFDQLQGLLDKWARIARPENAKALRVTKIRFYVRAGQLTRADEYVSELVEKAPRDLGPRQALVSALFQEAHPEEAMRRVKRWLGEAQLAPSHQTQPDVTTTTQPTTQPGVTDTLKPWCSSTIVNLLLGEGKFKEALKQAQTFLAETPNDFELLNLEASCFSELNRHDEEIASLEKALTLRPNDKMLNNNLGYLYADRGIYLTKAEKMIHKAIEGVGKEINILDSLGWVLYKQGRLLESGRIFQQIIQRQEESMIDHPVIFDHAGDVYYRLGAPDEAIELWKRAIELGPTQQQPTREIRRILSEAPGKISAVQTGGSPQLAPIAGEDTETKNR